MKLPESLPSWTTGQVGRAEHCCRAQSLPGCRENKGLAEEDGKQEDRLAGHLFRLLRCGRLQEACLTAAQASQPWRAMSMAGGGPWGPLPLGQAALEAKAASNAESVAGEDEHGPGASRALWKWACYQASFHATHSLSQRSSQMGPIPVDFIWLAVQVAWLFGI